MNAREFAHHKEKLKKLNWQDGIIAKEVSSRDTTVKRRGKE